MSVMPELHELYTSVPAGQTMVQLPPHAVVYGVMCAEAGAALGYLRAVGRHDFAVLDQTVSGTPTTYFWDGHLIRLWPTPDRNVALYAHFSRSEVLPIDPAWRAEYEDELKRRRG